MPVVQLFGQFIPHAVGSGREEMKEFISIIVLPDHAKHFSSSA
jgi:hypothetical protein